MESLTYPLCSLNLEVARSRDVWLSRAKVAEKLAPHFPEAMGPRELNRLLSLAEAYGLVSLDRKRVLFPLSQTLDALSRSSGLNIAARLADLVGKGRPPSDLRNEGVAYVDRFLALYAARPREQNLLAMREGLLGRPKCTLTACGAELGISLKTARQIETRMWNEISRSARNAGPLMDAFICTIAGLGGQRVFSTAELGAVYGLEFLSRAMGLTLRFLKELGLFTLGVDERTIKRILALSKDVSCVSVGEVERRLRRMRRLSVSMPDRRRLATAVAEKARAGTNLAGVVGTALLSLGGPAHYTEIAKECSRLWPEREWLASGVLAALQRQVRRSPEESPWVWTGLRGVYALKEWGFERPERGLVADVVEIVQAIHGRTGKPVPFSTIQAEVGRRRQLVNANSLSFACQFNPRLKSVGQDRFLPADETAGADESGSSALDDLDRRLRRL